MSRSKNILVTGGAGFIGSHVVRRLVNQYPLYQVTNLDKLSYAGNLENLRDVEEKPNYRFVREDILNRDAVARLIATESIDTIVHLAAESHVDRSLDGPEEFATVNIIGTIQLLNAARQAWNGDWNGKLFYHISTDEVYGSLEKDGLFTEETPLDPKSPYSASKAGSDHFVRAFENSYGLPAIISRCSNNYGPNQFPEKLIPLMINNILHSKPLPVYGKGENVRDWLYVEDHALAIDAILHQGKAGRVYNIGGLNEWKNLDLIMLLCSVMDRKLRRSAGESAKLITFVKDRPGHDLRYAIDPSRLMNEIGWKPSVTFEQGLERTVDWYLKNTDWLSHVTSGSYRDYYQQMYHHR